MKTMFAAALLVILLMLSAAHSQFYNPFPTAANIPLPGDALVCDGVTDDAPALQALMNVASVRTIRIPASTNGCLLNSLVTYNAAAGPGPILIAGLGPQSKLLVNNATGGLKVTAICGAQKTQVYMRDFEVLANVNSGYGIEMLGQGSFSMDNIDVLSQSGKVFNKGIWLACSQQGGIMGGWSNLNTTGIYLDDDGAAVSSNGIFIGGGRTFTDATAAIDLEGGASDLWVEGVHITSSSYGIIVNQNLAEGNGKTHLKDIHTETNATWAIEVRAGGGGVEIDGLNDYNTHSLHWSGTSGNLNVVRTSLLNGTVSIASGNTVIFETNTMLGTVTNSGTICVWHNEGGAAPSTPVC